MFAFCLNFVHVNLVYPSIYFIGVDLLATYTLLYIINLLRRIFGPILSILDVAGIIRCLCSGSVKTALNDSFLYMQIVATSIFFPNIIDKMASLLMIEVRKSYTFLCFSNRRIWGEDLAPVEYMGWSAVCDCGISLQCVIVV